MSRYRVCIITTNLYHIEQAMHQECTGNGLSTDFVDLSSKENLMYWKDYNILLFYMLLKMKIVIFYTKVLSVSKLRKSLYQSIEVSSWSKISQIHHFDIALNQHSSDFSLLLSNRDIYQATLHLNLHVRPHKIVYFPKRKQPIGILIFL